MLDLKELFGYQGKKVVISGSASGMSEAATKLLIDLGAEVYAVDINDIHLPVKQSFKANLSNKEEIDRFIMQLPEKIDCLFLCHGIQTHPGNKMLVEKVNFLSQKYIAESLLPRISDCGSVTFISSFGGFGWEQIFPQIQDLLDAKTWEDGIEWLETHKPFFDTSVNPGSDYTFAKMSLNAYVVKKCHAPEYISRKIRLNAICPGDTITGLTEAFYETSSSDGTAESGKANIEAIFLNSWNGHPASSEEMGYPLVCVGSDIFSYMSGQNIYIDYGLASSFTAGALLGATTNAYEEVKKDIE